MMVLNFLKNPILTAFGFAGVGTVSPIAWIIGTRPHFLLKWSRRISHTEPILDCNDNGRHYKVYLVFKDERADRGDEDLGLKVVDVNKSNAVKWVSGVRGAGQHWSSWNIRLGAAGTTDMQVPENDRHFSSGGYKPVQCQASKFEKNLGTGHGQELARPAEAIKFELATAGEGLGWIEKDINIASGSNLKWGTNFKPKVIFTAL